MDSTIILSVGTLIAAVTSAIFSIYNWHRDGKKRVAEMRLKWVEEIRDEMVIFFAIATTMVDSIDKNKLYEMKKSHFKIDLLLNDEEEDHLLLMEKLSGLVEAFSFEKEDEVRKLYFESRNMAKKVTKKEWSVIKAEMSA